MENKKGGDVPAFQLQNSSISNRCKDVFSSLDALEQKHQAFEQSRAREDADADRRLIHQSPSQEETETVNPEFKHPSYTGRDYHESKKGGRHGHERVEQHQQFRKPLPPQTQFRGRNSTRGRYGRGRATPDYKLNPERWTEYSLEDVDTSDSANKRAALDFLHERRKTREEGLKEEAMDLDTSACSKGQITFKKPTKDKSNSGQNPNNSTEKAKSSVEKMEEDDDEDLDDVAEEDLDCPSVSKNISSSLKRKLENIDIRDESETANDLDRPTGFKSRKFIKRNFRSQREKEEKDTIE